MQELLQNSGKEFLSSSEFSGNFPDLNNCENLVRIFKGRVKNLTANFNDKSSLNDMQQVMTEVIKKMQFDSQLLFGNLIRSGPPRT